MSWACPCRRRDSAIFLDSCEILVRLVDEAGRIWGQKRNQPERGFYPTSYREQGEKVRDEHVLEVPSALKIGQYELRTGMHLLEDMRRVPVLGGEAGHDWVSLTTIRVRDQ